MSNKERTNAVLGKAVKRVEIALISPSVNEYLDLRAKVGWDNIDSTLARLALDNSLFSVGIRRDGILLGMARVIGDAALFFYIQDVVVDPQFQGEGIGHLLMNEIEKYLAHNAKSGATIGLLSAVGKEEFYLSYGYQKRNGEQLGMGMCKFL